jgi:tRNA (guanine37-N1)-methyltransferase
MRLYVGLIHYPVYNKNNEKIASAITNFDLHDISRLSRTYGVKRFLVITPLEDQQELINRIVKHWTRGYGASYNSFRKEALELIDVNASLEQAVDGIKELEDEKPLLIATDASERVDKKLKYSEFIEVLDTEKPVLLIFGTAWGLHEELLSSCDYVLEPVWGIGKYNHLSVRTAAAIILDRVAGRYWK